ncbi:MAG: diguanylate cyclase [Shimia sp.]|uniref:diguanylate cyclase n=1 Tax=Shimia sp. TaxID=1954381 RepID=UPI004058755B
MFFPLFRFFKYAFVVVALILLHSTTALAEGPHFAAPPDEAFSRPYQLEGQWQFAWDRFLTPTEAVVAFGQSNLPFVPVPERWETYLPDMPGNPFHHGKATYIARLTLGADAPTDLMIQMGGVQDAYRLIWVPLDAPETAQKIAQEGNLTGPSLPALRGLRFPFPAQGDGLVVLHVRKDVFSEGGPRYAPEIIRVTPSNVAMRLENIKSGLVFGVLLLICLRLAALWPVARLNTAAMALAVTTVTILFRTVAVSGTFELLLGPEWHPLRFRLEASTMPVMSFCLVALNQTLFSTFMPRGLRWIIYTLSAAIFMVVLLVPSEWMTLLIPVYQVHMISVFCLCGVFTVFAVRRREAGIWGLVIVTICAFVAGVHDIIAGNTDGYDFAIAEYGMLLVMLYYSNTVTKRISEAIKQAARLEREKALLSQAHDDAVFLANHDHLTGLSNRQSFDAFWLQSWHSAENSGCPLTVVLFDIDHFKQVNDTYGHATGDAVLKALAHLLSSFDLRKTDHLSRFGGEEFALILPNCTQAEGIATAERLRHAIAATLLTQSGPQLAVTCSFGVAGTDMAGASTAADLLKDADAALYQAKENGRNQVYGVGALLPPTPTPAAA